MRYAEYLPGPRVARLVERFWLLEGRATGAPDAIIPDGRVELVFHYCGAFWRHPGGAAAVRQPASLLVGQMIEPVVLAPEGDAGVAAIRLRPAAARTLLGFSMRDVSGRFVDLDTVFPSAALVRERLAEAEDDAQRVAVLEEWLIDRSFPDPRAEIEAAVATIVGSGGRATIDGLPQLTGVGLRQLERRFQDAVGLSPKTFAKIVRLQAALRGVRRGRSLVDVALACGYYDQAHMARDFRELAMIAPGAWQTHTGDLASLFIGGPPSA
jgi:AraC-like DNA-binding protein